METCIRTIWSKNSDETTPNFVAFASDSTGRNVTGVTTNKGIYLSHDFGVSFTIVADASKTRQYSSISMSDDGVYQYGVLTNYGLIASQNGGYNWTLLNTYAQVGNTIYWYTIANSGNGSCVYAASNGIGGLYYSHNYGANFTYTATAPLNAAWTDIASSQSGQHVAVVNEEGDVYISSDYGVVYSNGLSLSSVGVDTEIMGVTMDWSGQYLAIALFPGAIWTSDNFGLSGSWVASSSSASDYYVAIAGSKDGNYLFAGTQTPLATLSGVIYSTYPEPPFATDDQSVDPNSGDDDSNSFIKSDGGIAVLVIVVIIGAVILGAIVYHLMVGKSVLSLCTGGSREKKGLLDNEHIQSKA
eukprot:gene25746-32235_t